MIDHQLSSGVRFEDLGRADLIVDREYLGGSQKSMADDPIGRLLPVGTLGGIRYKGPRQAPRLVVLYTSGAEADWPDELDPSVPELPRQVHSAGHRDSIPRLAHRHRLRRSALG